MTFGSEGATAMAPIDKTALSSKTGVHVTPPLVVLKTPPTAPATYIVSGSPGSPTNTGVRPACAVGPMLRHCRRASASNGDALPGADDWAAGRTPASAATRTTTAM